MRARPYSAVALPRGFTLIELLVVIFIIGVLVSVVGIAVSVLGRDREVEDQAKRLWAVLSAVKDEAELSSRNIGVLVDQTGYEFVFFDATRWEWLPIVDDDLLTPRDLPEGLQLRLRLEDRDVVLKPRSERIAAAKKAEEKKADEGDGGTTATGGNKTLQDVEIPPQIMLLASGDINSFDVSIAREGADDHRWRVYSKPDNTIEVGEADAPP